MTPDIQTRLGTLRGVLDGLPTSLPLIEPSKSKYSFVGFEPDPDLVEETGCISGAINKTFEIIFDWKSRMEGDRIIPIMERGPGIAAVVDVLEAAISKEPGDAVLEKWVNDLILSAQRPSQPAVIGRKRKRSEPNMEDAALEGELVPYVPPAANGKPKIGQPTNRDIESLTTLWVERDADNICWRCVSGCGFQRAGRLQRQRVLKHAAGCADLEFQLKQLATDLLTVNVPDDHVSVVSNPPVKKSNINPLAGASGMKQLSLHKSVAKKKKKQENMQIESEFFLVKLVCLHGMVPRLMDSSTWKDYVHFLNQNAPAISSDVMRDCLIPSYSGKIRNKQVKIIQGHCNNTMTFDGGSTRKKQSVYTVHATTPDCQVYCISGEDDTNHSHTGEYLAMMLKAEIHRLGVSHFAGLGSDNTGNTKKARCLICATYPTIINFIDSIHHLNLTIKDITSLPKFELVISQVKCTLTYFNKSWHATSALAAARKQAGSTSIASVLKLIRELTEMKAFVVEDVNDIFTDRVKPRT
ncbi:hypothetical protein M422DRAFT_275773 [Sphaerobolus stellatus SS14]|uniref:DUF659 domain-containing protein n=1 Tax=Sphaerobolus stellatus (strain SS14) TaxID=990650 RepID=A0A0C9UEG9_SPHS4|nr:hypothetical protein M422DRAFT_275773 [Sphaerobolus stellatus SS14]